MSNLKVMIVKIFKNNNKITILDNGYTLKDLSEASGISGITVIKMKSLQKHQLRD